jgi:hypothetical protein
MPVLRLPITIIGAASLLCAVLLTSHGGLAASATVPVGAPAVPSSAARVLWVGDAETGDLSQFQDGPWNDVGGTAPRIVTSPVRSGKHLLRLPQ